MIVYQPKSLETLKCSTSKEFKKLSEIMCRFTEIVKKVEKYVRWCDLVQILAYEPDLVLFGL